MTRRVSLWPLGIVVLGALLLVGVHSTGAVLSDTDRVTMALSGAEDTPPPQWPTETQGTDSERPEAPVEMGPNATAPRYTLIRGEECGGLGGLAHNSRLEPGLSRSLGGYTVRIPTVYRIEEEIVGFRFVATEPIGSVILRADGNRSRVDVARFPDGRQVGTVWFRDVALGDGRPGITSLEFTTCLPPAR
jgi:hypothetical protein